MNGVNYGAQSWQDLLETLQGYGIGGGSGLPLTGLNMEDIGSSQIMSSMYSMFPALANIEGLSEGMFPTLSKSALKGAKIGSYSDLFRGKQQSLLPSLLSSYGGVNMKKMHGNLAGSGAALRAPGVVLTDYHDKMSNAYSSALQSKQANMGMLAQQVRDWLTTAESMTGSSS